MRFVDTRPDDPNDIVPHQDRRELRAYGVFAAWLNHVDAKAINSLDVLVSENGKSFVRHYLIDFGSALGSGGVAPADYWAGSEYLVQPRDVARQMVSFGFSVPKWRTTPFYEARAIGRLPRHNADFNPDLWKPRVPNQAFLHARSDDKFWAAQKLVALTTDMIRAAVRAGEFGDPAAEEFLVRALAERRDAIGRAYLTAVNPDLRPGAGCGGHPDVQECRRGCRLRENRRAATARSGRPSTTRPHEATLLRRDSVGGTPQLRRRPGFRATTARLSRSS